MIFFARPASFQISRNAGRQASWELLGKPGEKPTEFSITGDESIELLKAAIKQAIATGLPWRTEPLKLKPAKKLVELVRKSQQLAVTRGADD